MTRIRFTQPDDRPVRRRSMVWLAAFAGIAVSGAGGGVGSSVAKVTGTAPPAAQEQVLVVRRIRFVHEDVRATPKPIQVRLAWVAGSVEAPSDLVGVEFPPRPYWYDEGMVPVDRRRRSMAWVAIVSTAIQPIGRGAGIAESTARVGATSAVRRPAPGIGASVAKVAASLALPRAAGGVGGSVASVRGQLGAINTTRGVSGSVARIVGVALVRLTAIDVGGSAASARPSVGSDPILVRGVPAALMTQPGYRDAILTTPGQVTATLLTTGGDPA